MNVKRELHFEDLQAGVGETRNLLQSGYRARGKWNLAQCCGHLNQWLSFPMDGYPQPGMLMGGVLWMMRHTVGPRQLRSVIRKGFSPGLPTMPETVPRADDATDADAVSRLSRTVERFGCFDQPVHASPLFGRMDKSTALNLQLRHFEHHLGFFWPNV